MWKFKRKTSFSIFIFFIFFQWYSDHHNNYIQWNDVWKTMRFCLLWIIGNIVGRLAQKKIRPNKNGVCVCVCVLYSEYKITIGKGLKFSFFIFFHCLWMWNKCNVSLVDIFVSDETFFLCCHIRYTGNQIINYHYSE